MHLYEEYAFRHSIKYNFIKHTKKSITLLKQGRDLFVFDIELLKNQNSPDKYIFKLNNNESFVEVHEYQNYLQSFIKNSLFYAIEDEQEAFLSFWKLFVIRNEVYFLENYNINYLYDSLNSDLDFDHKKQLIIIILKELDLIKKWSEFEFYMKNYSYYLAKLINQGVV
jgi:hypothetical protein